MTDIRHRTLTALALNRTPGFHFAGNFLGVTIRERTPQRSRVNLTPGPFCAARDGQVDLSVTALLADVALASVVRANLSPAQRLATVALHLQFTGERIAGRLEGTGDFEGFLSGAAGRQGLSRATVHANGHPVLHASGTFMVLDPPPGVAMHPIVDADHSAIEPLTESALTVPERKLLARVEAALANTTHDPSFIERLWGYHPQPTAGGAVCVVANGPHLGNRVGHMQGGLQIGLAASTANAALPTGWMLSGISAYFISPGEGRTLRAASRLVHRGRHTAVVRTVITGKQRRRILEVVSTHAWRGHRE